MIEKRLAVLNWIYPEDFDHRHKAIVESRVKNSGQWFLKSAIYQEWRNTSSKGALFCHGIRKISNIDSRLISL